jgi:hypothetical protein
VANQSKKKDAAGAKKAADALQPAPKVMRPERVRPYHREREKERERERERDGLIRRGQVSYRVQKDEAPSYASLVIEGPDIGKYRDERTGILYESSSDWIRAMVSSCSREKKSFFLCFFLSFSRWKWLTPFVCQEHVDSARHVSFPLPLSQIPAPFCRRRCSDSRLC